jgi:hypothetical protein
VSSLLPPSVRALWLRWRLVPGREPVPIARLASPLRYDLVVRREFLRLCLAQLERGGECDESLTGVARSTPYWLWFTEVYVPRSAPELARDAAARGRAFTERVRASFELAKSFRERGFDARHPIVLRAGREILPTDTGKLVRAPYYAGDGCHRIALLWLSGREALEPGQYMVRRQRALAPLDNTFRLREGFAGDRAAYLRFIASGYAEGEFASEAALVAHVRAREPERADELVSVLAVDAR